MNSLILARLAHDPRSLVTGSELGGCVNSCCASWSHQRSGARRCSERSLLKGSIQRCNMTIWCDAKTAVQAVKSGDRLFIPGRCTTPTPLIEALVARGEELRDVEILEFMPFGPTPYLDPRWEGHFHVRTIFVSESTRAAINAGRASYVPIYLSNIPKLFGPGGPYPLDEAIIQVSPPDKHGYCSLGPCVDATRAAVDHARQVVALVNPNVPRVYGHGFVHVSRLDYAVKWDGPLYYVKGEPPNETQRVIGQY